MNTNQERKIVGILLIIMLITALFTTSVWATEETEGTPTFTNFDNATFSITRDDAQFFFHITGATLKNEARRTYYLFLTNGSEEPVIEYTESGTLTVESNMGKAAIYLRSEKDSIGTYLTNRLEKAGDIYATIVEYDGEAYMNAPSGSNKRDFYKTVVTKKKVARPETLPITRRMTGYFFEDYSTIFEWEISGNKNRNCNIKVGRVADNNVLKAIKNGDKNCLSNLMSYAKNATALYQTQLKTDYSLNQKSIMNEFQAVDGAYYFVYFSLDTESGKYYPIEDVMLYQCINKNNIRSLINYLDKDFAWNVEEDGNPNPAPANNIAINQNRTNTVTNSNKPTGITGNMDNTKAGGTIPQTGSIPMITIGILAAILLAGGFAYYQNRKYKGI